MAQENPADTAGPSSPPPRLPEGWLPQWEGVQRKWYYVQRATGKSQWEIPTEPVVLTPSTTPTSIGTGPSQAPPSRPSTDNPQVPGPGESYPRSTFVAENSGNASLRDGQFVRQPGYPPHGASGINWYAERPGHYSADASGPVIGAGPSGYASVGQIVASLAQGHGVDARQHGSTGNTGPGIMPLHSDQNHLQGPMNNSSTMRDLPGATGDNSNHAIHEYSRVAGTDNGGFHNQGFVPNYSANVQAHHAAHQLQWQAEQHHAPLNAQTQFPPSHYDSSVPSKPFRGTYATIPSAESVPGAFGTHSLHPANTQQSNDAQQHAPYQTSGYSSSHIYPSRSTAFSQYHSTGMGRTQSGPGGNSLGFPATSETQGNAQNYRNPLVQASLQQYIPQQQTGYFSGASLHHGPASSRQAEPSPSHQAEWSSTNIPLRTAASDPQFVSGPWASPAPSRGGPSRAPRYD